MVETVTYHEGIQYAYRDPERSPHRVDHCDKCISSFEAIQAGDELGKATEHSDLHQQSMTLQPIPSLETTYEWEEDGGTTIIAPPVCDVRTCDPCRTCEASKPQSSWRCDRLQKYLHAWRLGQSLFDACLTVLMVERHDVE
jgi:hypothetical protein